MTGSLHVVMHIIKHLKWTIEMKCFQN